MLTPAVVLLLLSAGVQAAPSSEALGTSTASLYQSIRRNLLEAAQQMPEEHYGFRPTPDVRTFGQLVGHVANTSYNFCGPVTKVKPPQHPNLETLTAKEALVKALSEALAFCDQAYDGLTDERLHAPASFGPKTYTAGYLLMYNIAHDNEHYGNVVTYLRLKGLVPPSSGR